MMIYLNATSSGHHHTRPSPKGTGEFTATAELYTFILFYIIYIYLLFRYIIPTVDFFSFSPRRTIARGPNSVEKIRRVTAIYYIQTAAKFAARRVPKDS